MDYTNHIKRINGYKSIMDNNLECIDYRVPVVGDIIVPGVWGTTDKYNHPIYPETIRKIVGVTQPRPIFRKKNTVTDKSKLIDSINHVMPHRYDGEFTCIDIRKPRHGDHIIAGLADIEIDHFITKGGYPKPIYYQAAHDQVNRPIFEPVKSCAGKPLPKPVVPPPLTPPKAIYFNPLDGTTYTKMEDIHLSESEARDFVVYVPVKKQSMKLIRRVTKTEKI